MATTNQQRQITIVVAVIRNEKGEVLLVKRHQPEIPEIHGLWEFPGGGVEFAEDPAQAVKREAKEELGVEIEIIRLLPKVISDMQNFSDGSQTQVIVISYECKIIGGQPKIGLDPEIGDMKFAAVQEISDYNTFRNILETVKLLEI